MYLNNGSFKSQVDPHQFNLKEKKDYQKLAGLWLAGEMVNHIGIYGSKVAEGLSTFQRRSCYQITNIFICENACENVVCEMADILSGGIS